MNEDAWNLYKNFYDSLIAEYKPNPFIAKSLDMLYNYVKITLHGNSKSDTMKFEFKKGKIEACRSNLFQIIKLLKETNGKRDKFTRNFSIWKMYRTEDIIQLGNIAKALHEEKKIINVAKIAGAAVGIAGGAAIIGSLFFPPAAIATVPWLGALGSSAVASFLPSFLVTSTPAVSALAVGGSAATAASTAVGIGLTAAEILLLKKHMDEASKVIEEDAKCFRLMEEWFTHTQQFIDVMQNFFGSDVLNVIFKDLLDFITTLEKWRFITTYDKYAGVFNTVLRKIGHCLIPRELKIAAIGILLVFFLIHRRNRTLLCFIISIEGLVSLASVVDASFMGASATATLVKEGAKVSSKKAPDLLVRNITVGAFAGVGIALNAANIVLTSLDIYEGSMSKYGKKLEEIQNKLQEELELFEQVNEELNSKLYTRDIFSSKRETERVYKSNNFRDRLSFATITK